MRNRVAYWTVFFTCVAVAIATIFMLNPQLTASDENVVKVVSPDLPNSPLATSPLKSQAGPASKSLGAKLPLTSGAKASAPLPPLNTKVKDVIAQLKADADRGVVQAACRLGEELTRCWQTKQNLEIRDQLLSRLSSISADSEQAKAIGARASAMESSMRRDRDLCQDVGDADMQDAWRYLFSAALAGNTAAQAQFAVNPPLSAQDPVGSLDGWTAYQQYSPAFLRGAIEGGNIRALYLAFFSAATGIGPGGQAIGGRDAYQALVYGQALLSLVDQQTGRQILGQLAQLQSEVPSSAAQAAQKGQDLRVKFFGGKEPLDVSSNVGTVNPAGCAQ